jgi:hypothetical protein
MRCLITQVGEEEWIESSALGRLRLVKEDESVEGRCASSSSPRSTLRQHSSRGAKRRRANLLNANSTLPLDDLVDYIPLLMLSHG